MKSGKRKIIIGLIFIFFIFVAFFWYKNSMKESTVVDLINISDVSESFMNDYFEKYNGLNKDDKENMLIVISSKKITEEKYGANEVIEGPNNKYYLIFDDDVTKENAISQLSQEKFVHSVEKNIIRKVLVTENEENTQESEVYNSWGIQAMGLDYAMETISNLEANEVTVAILDTGLDVNLFNKYYSGRIKTTYNVLPDDEDTSMYDNYGHGTHIAGTIAEGTPDNIKIIPVKISDGGNMLESDILAAFEYITYYADVDVINMSFGGYEYSDAEYQAIEAARQKNIIAVAAAGNDNTSNPMYPASFDNTISIASVDSSLIKSEFSNYGKTIDFAAPGTDINSIMASYMKISANEDGDGDHETISGTSMATPHAVSAVAILKSINKEITLENVVDLLKNKAVDLGGKDFDMYYGNGLINYNDVDFCTNEEMSCDEFNIFKVIKPINMTIDEVTYTSYNYGSLSNIIGTKVYFEEADGLDYTKELWELDDLTITGYDPYNNDEQTVTVNYLDLELSFKVDNPDNYESGWEYQLYNEKYYLSKYKDNDINIGKLYLPEQIDGLTISGILNSNDGNSILFNNSDDSNYFEEIILPSNIIEVGSYVFAELPKCTKVVSEANEINVNIGSFSNMPNLTTIEGNIVFSEDSYDVFSNDVSLKDVTISENTSDILPSGAFSGCASLGNITLPNIITTIGGRAFSESGLNSIELSSNLKSIGGLAFYNSKLESINLPNSLEEIGPSSFSTNNLKTITIPKSVNLIANAAFAYNPLLDSITVDEENEVYDSRNDSNVIIETSTNKIIQGSNNATIPNSVVTIGDNSFAGLYIEELDVPEGVTSIEENAFMHADFLEKIVLPNSLTNIHSSVFSYYENIDEQKLLGGATSGAGTGIGTTVLWVNEDSYAYEFAVNNDKTYVIIGDSSDAVEITNISWMLEKTTFYPEEKLEDYIDWIKYNYIDGEEVKETEVQNYTVEYQNGDSIGINDYAAFIKFDLEHSYQNIKIRPYINVVEEGSDKELPVIEAVIGDYVCNYEFPDGIFSPYGCTTYTEVGEYTLLGDYTLNDTGETLYSVEVTVRVLNKELVYNFAQRIIAKNYDGTTAVDPNNIILGSYRSNIGPSDYTIVSAELDSPDVSPKTLVRIKARINDDSYEKFAFSGNEQEIEFTGYTAVIDFEIPEINLLIGEEYYETCLEDGCLKGYGSNSFEEPGDYTIIGYYSYNDGSGMIDDIAIPVHVIDKRIVWEWAEISPKEYDGTTNIDINTITLPDIDKSQYTIISAELDSPNVSEWGMAKIKVKLNDTFYENYAFTGNKQESEWVNPITILKAKPEYDVPVGLIGQSGQLLSEIELPEGFEWTDGTQVLSTLGDVVYTARYTPNDTNNYEIVENIGITVTVSGPKDVIAPEIVVTDKVYDGTSNVDSATITVTNLDSKYYTITNSGVENVSVGTTVVGVTITLTDEAFDKYCFEGNSQVYTENVSINIIPAKVNKPVSVGKSYIYIGEEQTYLLIGYNSDIMSISGNTRVDAGEQKVIVSLADSNYTWEDGTADNVEFIFTIEKADANILYTSSDNIISYDGGEHGIVLDVVSPDNVIVKYMDIDGNYTLDTMPMYSELGSYTIKFKLYINDNYHEVYDEQVLNIISGTVTNNSSDYEGIYDEEAHSINIDISIPDYDIKYSLDGINFDLNELPTFTDVGEYVVYYEITSDYYEKIVGSNKVKQSLPKRNHILKQQICFV